MNIERCRNVQDFRLLAKKRLPAAVFHYLDGGADDELTLGWNTKGFEHYELLTRSLEDVSRIDMSVEVLGQQLSSPLIFAPTGVSRLFHHDGERATASAAKACECLYSLSTLSTVSIEELAQVNDEAKMFQIYIHKDRGLTYEFIERCRATGYKALCLTVDTPLAGNRERDIQTGMTMPPKFTLKSLVDFLLHPYWLFNNLLREKIDMANLVHKAHDNTGAKTLIEYVNGQFDRSINWKDAEALVREWNGEFAIKGILSAEDARRAADIGATAVIVSNHGGRQLDGTAAAVDCLADIVDVVGERVDVILDGGIRRGTHVVKALALGAKACMIGRPYLYGLAAGGEKGVIRVIELLHKEIERDLALLGCASLSQLHSGFIRRR